MTVNTLGSHEQYRSSRTDPSRTDSPRAAPPRTVAEWLWPFLPGGLAVFSLSAVFWYHTHRDTIEVRAPLQHLYAGIYDAFGLAPSVLFFLLVVIWSAIWLVTGRLERPFARLGRLVAMLVMLGIFMNLGDGGVSPAPNKGALGAWFAGHLVSTFTYVPSLIVVWAITFASLLLATDFCFHDAFERLRQKPADKAPDAGVEVAVTDHLRGLSTAMPPAAAFATAPVLASTATAELDVAPLDVEPEAAPEPEETAPGRRRSYFERRAEREGLAAFPQPVPEPGDELPVEAPAEPRNEAPIEEPAEESAEEPAEESVDDRFKARVEPSAASANVDLAIGDALQLDPPLESPLEPPGESPLEPPGESPLEPPGEPPAEQMGDRWVSEPAARTAPAAVYETPEAIEAAEVLADRAEDAADAEGANNGERWVPIPRPEPAPAALDEQPVADRSDAELPDSRDGDSRDGEFRDVEFRDAEGGAVEAVIAPQPARQSEPEPDQEPRNKQKRLFGGGLDDGLVQDAIEIVTSSRRASAAFLQRKLRIDYALAVDVLAELAARGVVAIDDDATQGRVLG